jgi:ABC-type dipeptide/oligopeptide/nickel transport system ATPase component
MSTVPADDSLQEYRRRVAAMVPPFLLPRRFTAAENWTKAATEDGNRYVGLFREQEPDLAAVLGHARVLIIGEPGAGKSTTALAIVQHVLNKDQAFSVPVFASLKSYDGDLRNLLLHQIPATILDDPALTRTYVLDGTDEVPPTHRDTLPQELDRLIATDAAATYVLTTRQAFHVRHPEAFPGNLHAYHLLNFDDKDIRAFTAQQAVTADNFLAAVREIGYEEEIRNPFALKVVTERYRAVGQLSPYRNENVKYVVDRLIDSRHILNPVRQRRALKMLAITCETSARNELKEEEALRVLTEAIDFSHEAAVQLLEELSQSILIRMQAAASAFKCDPTANTSPPKNSTTKVSTGSWNSHSSEMTRSTAGSTPSRTSRK